LEGDHQDGLLIRTWRVFIRVLLDAFWRSERGTRCACNRTADGADRWRGLKRQYQAHARRASLVARSIGDMRRLGTPLIDDAALKIEGYARFRLGGKED